MKEDSQVTLGGRNVSWKGNRSQEKSLLSGFGYSKEVRTPEVERVA